MSILTIPNSISIGLFSARMTVAQSVTPSTVTTAIFDNEIIDSRNQYNHTSGVFTCSVPGYWQFNTFLRFSSTASITSCYLQIAHNSNNYRGQQVFDASNTATTYVQNMAVVILLSAGDTVQVQGLGATTGTLSYSLIAGTFPSVFSGYLIAAT